MANFNTHLSGAAAVSGLLSSTFLLTGLFTPTQGMLLWGAGTLGGLLPDLDADNTPTLRGLFTALGVLGAFLCLFSIKQQPLLVMWGIMLGVFLAIRVGLMSLFARLTEHRGAFHSLLAAITFGLGTVYLCLLLLPFTPDLAWATGIMVGCGYLTHLVLDECFAVDLSNLEVKRSFGSALKPLSLSSWWASLLFLGFALYFAWATPLPPRLDSALKILLDQPRLLVSKPLFTRT